jgi:hypothetical protein
MVSYLVSCIFKMVEVVIFISISQGNFDNKLSIPMKTALLALFTLGLSLPAPASGHFWPLGAALYSIVESKKPKWFRYENIVVILRKSFFCSFPLL